MVESYNADVIIEQGGGQLTVKSGGAIDILASGRFELAGSDLRAELVLLAGLNTELVALLGLGPELDALDGNTTPIAGVAASYKIARGVFTPTAGQDTVATGLATVVAVVVSLVVNPTLTHMWSGADVGNQSGAPVAGSILINSAKPTGTGDVTPIAATTPWVETNWIAIGT